MDIILTNDLLSPKNSIIQAATTTGYIKFIVDAIPLAIFAYPSRRVMDVTDRRILSTTTFQASSNDESLRVFFLDAA